MKKKWILLAAILVASCAVPVDDVVETQSALTYPPGCNVGNTQRLQIPAIGSPFRWASYIGPKNPGHRSEAVFPSGFLSPATQAFLVPDTQSLTHTQDGDFLWGSNSSAGNWVCRSNMEKRVTFGATYAPSRIFGTQLSNCREFWVIINDGINNTCSIPGTGYTAHVKSGSYFQPADVFQAGAYEDIQITLDGFAPYAYEFSSFDSTGNWTGPTLMLRTN